MGGSKTAIFTQVVHFYSDGVDHITIGDNRFERRLWRLVGEPALHRAQSVVHHVGRKVLWGADLIYLLAQSCATFWLIH